jgi:hypothetical protein
LTRIFAVSAIALGLSAVGFAAEVKGFVQDQNCAGKPAMKDNAECAKRCVKNGSPAVLVAEDGTIYKIANQDKITSHTGEKVTVSGDIKGDTITVSEVK